MARLIRSLAYLYALAAILLGVSIDFAVRRHWVDFGVFFFVAIFPTAAAISLTRLFRGALSRKLDMSASNNLRSIE